MTDILIRDLPEGIVADIDSEAGRLGLSRVEYIRRQLIREARRTKREVRPTDLVASDDRLAGLLDHELMEAAWQ